MKPTLIRALVLCALLVASSGHSQQSQPQASASQRELGKPIALDNKMQLIVTVGKPEKGTVEVDKPYATAVVDRGLEVSLTFETQGAEEVKFLLMTSSDAKRSGVVLVDREGEEIAPRAMKLEGSDFGYRTVTKGGMFAIGNCRDNPPVALTIDGSHAGIGIPFCTKPGEKDTATVMFGEYESLASRGINRIRVRCQFCPKEGLDVLFDPVKLTAQQ